MHHLEVKKRSLFKPLRLQQLPLVPKQLQLLLQLRPDILQRIRELLLRSDEVLARVNVVLLGLVENLAGQRIDQGDALDLVTKELNPYGQLLVRWHDLQTIATHSESATP